MTGDTLQIDPPFQPTRKTGGGVPPHFQPEKKGGWGTPPRITNRRITNRQPRRGERVPPSPLCGWHFSGSFYSIVSHFFRSIVFSSTCNWKPFLPTIGGLDPRVPPGSVLLSSTVKLAPMSTFYMVHSQIANHRSLITDHHFIVFHILSVTRN